MSNLRGQLPLDQQRRYLEADVAAARDLCLLEHMGGHACPTCGDVHLPLHDHADLISRENDYGQIGKPATPETRRPGKPKGT